MNLYPAPPKPPCPPHPPPPTSTFSQTPGWVFQGGGREESGLGSAEGQLLAVSSPEGKWHSP